MRSKIITKILYLSSNNTPNPVVFIDSSRIPKSASEVKKVCSKHQDQNKTRAIIKIQINSAHSNIPNAHLKTSSSKKKHS